VLDAHLIERQPTPIEARAPQAASRAAGAIAQNCDARCFCLLRHPSFTVAHVRSKLYHCPKQAASAKIIFDGKSALWGNVEIARKMVDGAGRSDSVRRVACSGTGIRDQCAGTLSADQATRTVRPASRQAFSAACVQDLCGAAGIFSARRFLSRPAHQHGFTGLPR